MAVNDLIKTTDYNNLRADIIDIIGNGSATYGYGQTLQSSAKVNHEKIPSNFEQSMGWDCHPMLCIYPRIN